MRSASNSATIASMLNSSRPTGSVGSWIEPPRLSLTALRVKPEPELPPTPDPAGAEEDYEYEKDVYEREGCSAETPEGCRG